MIQFESLSKRQRYILEIIGRLGQVPVSTVVREVASRFDQTSRITIIRDLNFLLKKKLIKRKGAGRGVIYESFFPFFLRAIDTELYFSQEPDERLIQKEHLDFKNKTAWQAILAEEEIEKIHHWTEIYRKNIAKYDASMLKKEFERITIEFSWKSSHIEGNTYTLLDTERLIRQKEEAPGKKHEEAVMILNHKTALEYAWKYANNFQRITTRSIEELHDLIIANLGVKKGLRKHPVGIVGTAYKPYDNVFQIREALEELCALINVLKEPFLKALLAVCGFSYIQPFEDGNKRTSRLIGNALLLAYSYCPLSYRSISEIEYKKAIILFYEQHTLFVFKKLFLEQYEFAAKNYFL